MGICLNLAIQLDDSMMKTSLNSHFCTWKKEEKISMNSINDMYVDFYYVKPVKFRLFSGNWDIADRSSNKLFTIAKQIRQLYLKKKLKAIYYFRRKGKRFTMRSLVMRWLTFPIKSITEFRLPDHALRICSVSFCFVKQMIPDRE